MTSAPRTTGFLRDTLSPYHAPDLDGLCAQNGTWLYEQRVFNFATNRDTGIPLRCDRTGVSLAFWGRLDARSELLARLGKDAPRQGKDATDSELVLAAWIRWGEALPENLLGDFALAIVDPLRRSAFLARDALGVKPLYYLDRNGQLSFATSVAALRRLDQAGMTPDSDWMARYVLHLSMSHERTGYREVHKLPPGHCLTMHADAPVRLRRYHQWRDDAPSARRRDPRWVAAYREVLEESIRCRMDSDFPLGSENSGGIDSSTITAYLAHLLGEPGDRLHCFGFALCEQEPAFILETSQMRRIRHNYIVTAPGAFDYTDDRIERSLRVLGYPEEHGNGSGHAPFYNECEQRRIRTLFSGFGGDEVVTNDGQLLRYELLDSGDYANLWHLQRGNPLMRGLRLLKTVKTGRQSPAYRPSFLKAWTERWPHQLLRPEVVERLDLYTAYMETARYDAPYRRINDFIVNHVLAAPYVATRLENCSLMAASHGIDYRWPLWDVRLVQQYLSTPGIEKAGPGGMGRYLHRRAIDQVVPMRVAWKPSKDMGYGQVHQDLYASNVATAAVQARRHLAHLHPALTELIDVNKLRAQAAQAEQGALRQGLAFYFRRGVNAIMQLNHWLHDGPPSD